MSVINIPAPSDDINTEKINNVIDYSLSMSYMIREQVQEAPAILDSYSVLRSIMRMAKRGVPLNKAIEQCVAVNPDSCPTIENDNDDYECDNKCEECWRRAIDYYIEEYGHRPE